MLTADQIEVLGEQARQITDPIVEFLIEDIARRVSEAGQLTGTASYQVWRLQQLGFSQRQLKKELRKRLKVSHRELRKLLTQAAEVGYDFDIRHLPYVQAVPFKSNDVIQAIVEAAVDMARSDLTNMVQTLGFVNHDGVCRPLTEAYEKACDFAFQKVAFGAQDYNSAVRGAVRELAAKGIQTIDYESGVHTSLEAAVRRNVMGGLGLMQERISQQNHDDLGCNGWEISAHAASAPDHEPIQGKQYSDAQYTNLNNSLVRRIGTLNCGHAAFPIILGVNSPQYTTEQLEAFRSENEKGIEYEGQHYTMYEATQHQRKLERAIRKRKKKILLDESLHDEQRLAHDQTKLVRLNEEYARFTKAAGLRSQRERTMVAGFGAKEAKAASRADSSIARMAQQDIAENDWSKAIPSAVTKEQKAELVQYAADKGIKIPSLRYFDGDTELLRLQIDALSKVHKEIPTGKGLILSISQSLPDDDFAETTGNHITINRKALRNREVTETNLAEGKLFASTKVEDIAVHEYGHVIASAKGNKGVEIAQKTCYNLLKENLEMGNLLKMLRVQVSPYSTTYYAKGRDMLIFDPKRYKEIIPEVLARNNSNPSDFTAEFIRILREML